MNCKLPSDRRSNNLVQASRSRHSVHVLARTPAYSCMALRVDQVDDLLPRRLASCRLWAHTGENCRPAEIQDEGREMFSTPPAGKQGIHYHIRWSNSQIDWQPFNSSAEATAMAERL